MPVAPGTYNFVLAPWTRVSIPVEGGRLKDRWVGPPGTVVALDRRPRAAQAGTAQDGFGLFVLDVAADIPANALYLGNDLEAASVAADAEIISRMGLKAGDLGRATLLDTLWAEMTELADPTFVNRGGPLRPNSKGDIELRLHGLGTIRSEKFSKERHPQALTLAKIILAKTSARTDFRSMDRSTKQILTPAESKSRAEKLFLEEYIKRYNVDRKELLVPRGGASVQDTFAATSDTAIGSWTPTPGGSGSWTALNGSWTVYNTGDFARQTTVTDPGSARLNLDLSGDDMTVTANCDMVISFDAVGPLGRVSSSATDYICYSHDSSNSFSHELFTVTGGGTAVSVASLGSTYHAGPWTEDLILDLDGTSAICTEASTERVNTTVGSTWDGNTRVGIYMDEAAGNSGPYVNQIDGVDIGGGAVTALAYYQQMY